MAFFVHVTQACTEDAKQHGVLDYIRRIQQRVEEGGNYVGFGRMGGSPFLKRQVGNFRLVAWSKQFGDDVLLVFCRVFGRGERQYEKFLRVSKEKPSEAERELLVHLGGDSAESIYQQRRCTEPPAARRSLNEEEKRWLYPTIGWHGGTGDEMLLETDAWVQKLRSPRYLEKAALYHQLLVQLFVDRDGLKRSQGVEDAKVHWSNRAQLGVAYLWPENTQEILLIEPLRREDDRNQVVSTYQSVVRKAGAGLKDIRRLAVRGYPALMLVDDELWLQIEKDEDANLALSPEEAALLNGIRTGSPESSAHFPLFINGRAGSGKSTLLHYLLADYIDYAVRSNLKHRILYLTASADLAARARNVVRRVLGIHHDRLLRAPLPAQQVDEMVQGAVNVFHDFLYSLLPPEERGRFPRARFVDFAKFRRLWEVRVQRRKHGSLSPDLAWHTVRSYIKGLGGYQSYLEPHEFAVLPRRQRSLSVETYERVWKEVWQGWYAKLGDEGYWDDQDLVARVLELDLPSKQECGALFCDEAQDFTALDLEVIFQLSLFGRRSLTPEEFHRVPIVFAGDPLQTINPTGFRWDAVQADYHEKFAAVLDSRRWSEKPRISFRELSFNYRSNPGIVKFCNLLQLGRAVALDLRELKPQKPWWVTNPVQVQLVELDGNTLDKLRQRPDLVKIVNCEAGEETELVDNDPWLRDAVTEKIEEVYRNVLSPARAKGLEFPAVVLYRFGDTAPKDFYGALDGDLEAEARLPVEYFFNRLYVAASRAKTQLFIADTREAIDSFWRWATDTEAVDGLVQRLGRSEEQRREWTELLGQPIPANPEWWTGHQLPPSEQAVDYEREGEAKRDPYLLRQAAIAYRNAVDQRRAEQCLARAAELEGKYADAGERYLRLDMREDAYRCFWNGREWKRLCSVAQKVPRLANDERTHAAQFMASGKFHDQFLEFLVSIGRDQRAERASEDPVWVEVLRVSFERLKAMKAYNALPWAELCRTFVMLRPYVREIDLASLAEIAFRAEDYEQAVRLWEQADHTEHEQYYRAQAVTAPFPENLRWLSKLEKYPEIIHEWRARGRRLPPRVWANPELLRIVFEAARNIGEYGLAADILSRSPSYEASRELFKKLLASDNPRLLSRVAALVVRSAVREQHVQKWVPLSKLLLEQEGFADGLLLDGEDKVLESKVREPSTLRMLVRALLAELARSDRIARLTSEKEKLGAALRERVIDAEPFRPLLHDVSPFVVGAAIERVCKPDDAVRYYRRLLESARDAAERTFAVQRLVVSLERVARASIGERDTQNAEAARTEAQRLRIRHRLARAVLPTYPDLSGTSGLRRDRADAEQVRMSPPPPHGERILGPLRVEWSVPKRTVLVSHRARLETVKLDLSSGELRGDGDTEFARIPTEPGQQAWEIPAWPARIVVQRRQGRQWVRISTAGEHTDVELGS